MALTDSSQSSLIFTADRADRTVSFTAPAPWTATLEKTTRAQSDGLSWIELDKYEGKAGKTSITIRILESNVSGESRYAKITILCGDSRITIEIEQRTEGDDPDTPDDPDKPTPATVKYVSRVDYLLIDNRRGGVKTIDVLTYSYDERNRIVRISDTYNSENEYDSYNKNNGTTLYTLDYTVAEEITVRISDETDTKPYEKWIARLDDQGRVSEIREYDYESETTLSTISTLFYNDDGTLSTLRRNYSSYGQNYINENKFSYDAEGLLVRNSYSDSYDGGEVFRTELPADEFYPNRIANDKANLDFTIMIIAGVPEIESSDTFFCTLRRAGSFGKCLPEKTENDETSQSPQLPPTDYGWDTPNVTIHKTITYFEDTLKENEYLPVDFTTAADGCITQIAYGIPYKEYLFEYDIVVGSELLYEDMAQPGYPEEYKRYKYEIKNEKTTEQRDIINPVTINIAYR